MPTDAQVSATISAATKDKLDRPGEPVFYTLNVITGEASITRQGELVSTDETGSTLPASTTAWAELGKAIERREFESLRAAKEYRNESAIGIVESNMIRWGIIRAPRSSTTQ